MKKATLLSKLFTVVFFNPRDLYTEEISSMDFKSQGNMSYFKCIGLWSIFLCAE